MSSELELPERVLVRFGLNPIAITPLLSDRSSVVAAVRCTDGEFIVKAFRTETTIVQLKKQLQLRRILRSYGFRYLPPVLPSGEDEILLEEAGRIWSLSMYVPCDAPFDWTGKGWLDEHCVEAARVLAEFHCISYKALTDGLDPDLAPVDVAFFVEAWAQCRHKLLRLGCSQSTGSWRELAGHENELKMLLDHAISLIAPPSITLPQVIVHGDFHPGNLLFRGGKATTLLDLEYCSLGNPLVDLSYGVMMFFGNETLNNGINVDAASKFVHGYNTALDNQIPWVGWVAHAEGRREFEVRCRLSAFLMLFWSVNGAFDLQFGGVDQTFDSPPANGNDYEHGGRLALRLLLSEVSDSILTLVHQF